MTCIVSYIDNDIVYMAGDSAANAGKDKYVIKDHKLFYKYWHKKPIMLVGGAGSFLAMQLMQHTLPLTDPTQFDSDEHFIHVTMQQFSTLLYNATHTKKEENEAELLIGYNGKVYCCAYGYYVQTNELYSATGHGTPYAMGALHALKSSKMEPNKKLMTALNAACYHDTSCSAPYTFMQLPMKVED